MSMRYPAAMPHGPVEEPFEGVCTVRGTSRVAPFLSITRNMVNVRSAGELTIIGSVRLSLPAERALERLGTVRHLVRLGHFHGLDEGYYVKRYAPTVWATKNARSRTGVITGARLTPGEEGARSPSRLRALARAPLRRHAVVRDAHPGK